MKRRAPIWRKLVEEQIAAGKSHLEVALALGLPKGTVATWCARMKAKMKAAHDKETARDLKAGMKAGKEAGSARSPLQKLATFRGITALDLPGRTREIQSLNFAKFKRGQYPPRSAGIPGYLEGAELVAALRVWCGKWKGKK